MSSAVSLPFAQPALPPGEFGIQGRVLGPNGEPAAGAQVLVIPFGRRLGPAQELAAGADGGFVVSVEAADATQPVRLLARKAGLALDWVAVKPGDAAGLKLGADPVAFAGSVKGTDGEAIAGAQVQLSCLRWPEGYRPATGPLSGDPQRDESLRTRLYFDEPSPLSATSDAAGCFTIPGLPRAAAVTVAVTAEGRERFWSASEGLPAGTADCEIVLAQEAVIAGRVTHEGQPMSDLAVICSMDRFDKGSTQTGADGTYRLTGLSAGTYDVRPGGTQELTAAQIGPFTVKAGETAANADIAMIEGAVVRGTVRDTATGEPINKALVLATSGRDSGAAQTDARGAYALRVPPGTYTVSCYSFGPGAHPITPAEQTVTVGDKQIVEGIDFGKGAKGAAVKGRVVDPDGNPVAGAMVGSVVGVATSGKTFDSHFPATTDAEGRFELPIAQPPDNGRWPVLALHRERNLAGIAWLPKGEVPEEEIEVGLRPGGRLKGSVVDTDGKPLASIPLNWTLVGPEGLGWGVEAGETDAKGEFSLGPLPPGQTYCLRPGGQYAHLVTSQSPTTCTVGAGVDRQMEPIILQLAGRTVQGMVLDAEQRPVANVTVYVSGKEEGVRSAADGRWELTGLPQQGTLWIVAIHPTQRLVAAEKLDPDWEVEAGLILLPPTAATGRLLDEAGNPVAGVKLYGGPQFPIEVGEGGELDSYTWQRELVRRLGHPGGWIYLRTDADGRWRAEGLIPGVEYVFSVELPDQKGARVLYDFIVGPGDITEVADLTVPAPAP